jgi:hypothetical protein
LIAGFFSKLKGSVNSGGEAVEAKRNSDFRVLILDPFSHGSWFIDRVEAKTQDDTLETRAQT